MVLLLLVGLLGIVLLKSRIEATMLSPETQEQASGEQQGTIPEGEAAQQPTEGTSDSQGGTSEAAQPEAHAPSSTDDPEPQTTEPGGGQDGASPVQEGYATYVTSDAQQLKYVDAYGVAQVFTDDPIWLGEAPYIASGTSLVAKEQPESYGRYHEYQQLSDGYLDDLKADVVRFANGTNTFDSQLARAVGGSQYLNLLGALSQLDQTTLDATVVHLVVDSMV